MTDTPKNYGIIGIGMDYQLYTRETLNSPWVLVPNSAAPITITIMSDGKILSVGKDCQLYVRDTLHSPWVVIQNSGSVIGAAMMHDGKILAIGMNNQLYTRDTLTSIWVHIPNSGTVKSVTIMQDGKILGVGMDNQLYTRDTLTSSWVLVPNSAAVKSVTTTLDGKILGVGMDNQLYTRDTLTSSWVQAPNSAAVFAVASDLRKEQENLTPELKSRGIIFDGSDARIAFPYPIPSLTDAITIEFWANGGNKLPSNNSVFEAYNEQNQRVLNIHLPWGNGYMFWDAGNQNGYDRIDRPVQPQEYKGIWTHWAFIKDVKKGQMLIYRNGTLWHQSSSMFRTLAGIKQFSIGSYVIGTAFWNGTLTEFRIWNKVCTEQEINSNMKLRMTGKEAGIVAYYPMNKIAEGTERKLMDLSANGYHGVVLGSAVLSDEFELGFSIQIHKEQEKLIKPLKGIFLDGQKDDVEAHYHIALNPDEFTLTSWVKPTGKKGVWRSVVCSSSPKRGYMLYAGDNDRWQFWVGAEKLWYKLIGAEVILDKWTHLAATYSNGIMKLYVDGILVGEQKGKYAPTTNPLRIGSGDANVEPKFFFTGQIAEVCIWKKALSVDNILNNMDIQLTGKEDGLTAYWPMKTIIEEAERKTPDMTANKNFGLVRGDIRIID
jgi:hypothetical protein